jgi:hypothetical protein
VDNLPMKKNIEWYPHRKDSHRHPKFKLLRATYGQEGWAYEGKFWALNNIIADKENCQLDLTKSRNKAVVAGELDLAIEDLMEFIATLCSDEIELLIEIESNIFTTKKIKESFEEAMKTREKARQRKGSPEKQESSPELLLNTEELFHTVKNSKVKNSTEHNSKEQETLTPDVDNSVDNSNEPSLLFNNFSSFTFYQDCLPFDFADTDSVRNSITKLIAKFCNGTAPTKSEITRIYNIVTATKGARKETCFRITAETLSGFNSLSPEKKNFAYLSQTIEGKIKDAKTKALEEKAALLKDNEKEETENFNGNINGVDLNVIADKLKFT